jgi:hypothetical protein
MVGDDDVEFRSERDVLDALRALKARSGLSYRDIAARMSRTDPRHAVARSTLANLLAGNSLPRRPGLVVALVEVLAAELNVPAHTQHYRQAWSRLIAARSRPQPAGVAGGDRPDPPTAAVAAAQPDACVRVSPPDRLAVAASPQENPVSGRQVGAVLFWLALLSGFAVVMASTVPGVSFWWVWLMTIWPLPLAALVNWFGRDRRRHQAGLHEAPAEYLHIEYRHSR